MYKMKQREKKIVNYTIFLLLLFSEIGFMSSLLKANLIKNYFHTKFIKSAVVFGCFNKFEQLRLTKELTSQTQPVTVLKINRTNIHSILETNHQQIGVVLDGDCDQSGEFLITCGISKFFDVKHHWLIVSNSNSVIKKLEKVILNIDADINIAIKNHSNHVWFITDVYNPASQNGGRLKTEKIGFYSQNKGYNARSNEAKYWKKRNMTGVTFKTMVVLLAPFNGSLSDILLSDDNRNVDTFNRFQNKLLRFCGDYYNFTMNVELGNSWGYPLPNGSFNGMVGALGRKLIDFGSSPIFVREDRAKFIDYGRNTWAWKAGFIFRTPKSRTSIEIFLKPLSTWTWLITGFLTIISIIILKVGTTFEKKTHEKNVETTWSLSFLFTFGALCQQGSTSVPKMACGRITAISIFFLSLIIYQFYSASIVSNLLMKPSNKIKDLKDLTESSLKVGCEDIIYNKELFAHTTDEILKKLYYKKIYGKGNTSHFFESEEGLKLVRKGGYAFHIEVARAYPIIEKTFPDNAICELREVKLFRNTDLYNTYQKASPFYDMLETCVISFQRLAENGILFREIKHWHPRKPECIQDSKSFITFHVGLDEFYPALLVLLIGMVISLVVFVAEKHFKMAKERKKQEVLSTRKLRILYTE